MVRQVVAASALCCAIGCSGGGGASTSAPAVVPMPVLSAAPPPAGSPAATYILSSVDMNAVTAPQALPSSSPDDGGQAQLHLPILNDCGNGALSNSCAAWVFGAGTASSRMRRPAVLLPPGQPPALNFCRDAGLYPRSDIGAPAVPIVPLQPAAFSLSYAGTRGGPIGMFQTRQWVASVQGGFSGSSLRASSIGVTPLLAATAGRGWLVFYTATWPADVLLVPYGVNEIQLPSAAAPFTVTAGSAANLAAFDCLGRPLTALVIGAGVGFDAGYTQRVVSSTGSELNVPFFATAGTAGSVLIADDADARALVPVIAH